MNLQRDIAPDPDDSEKWLRRTTAMVYQSQGSQPPVSAIPKNLNDIGIGLGRA
jgi:hypothetical protein